MVGEERVKIGFFLKAEKGRRSRNSQEIWKSSKNEIFQKI